MKNILIIRKKNVFFHGKNNKSIIMLELNCKNQSLYMIDDIEVATWQNFLK